MKNKISSLCFIVPGYPTRTDPQYSFVGELIRSIADTGIQCIVITPQSITHSIIRRTKQRPYLWQDKTSQGSVIEIYQPQYFSVSNVKILGRSISTRLLKRVAVRTFKKVNPKVDALYAHFWDSGVVAGEIANKFNLPFFVATGESVIRVGNKFSSQYVQKRMKNLKGVISVSTKNKNESLSLGLGKNAPYVVLPNAINTAKFKPLEKTATRESFEFSKDYFIISFVGSFIERKGPLRLLEAVRRLKDPSVKILFIGDGPQKPVGDEVLFAGRVPHSDVSKYLSASDVFVLPTLAEGCSNAIVEAMACGLPIISSDLEFNHDILDSENAILINPTDVTTISKAIYNIQRYVKVREQLASCSLNKAQELTLQCRTEMIMRFIHETI